MNNLEHQYQTGLRFAGGSAFADLEGSKRYSDSAHGKLCPREDVRPNHNEGRIMNEVMVQAVLIFAVAVLYSTVGHEALRTTWQT
jgi:hypothetical protein